MTEQFETWLEHQFPGCEYDDIVDFLAKLDELDIMSQAHALQALMDRYEDACGLAEADHYDYCDRLATIAAEDRRRAQDINRENGW